MPNRPLSIFEKGSPIDEAQADNIRVEGEMRRMEAKAKSTASRAVAFVWATYMIIMILSLVAATWLYAFHYPTLIIMIESAILLVLGGALKPRTGLDLSAASVDVEEDDDELSD